MEIDRSKISPMMRQYLETKDVYPDTLLFFRVGDFYETQSEPWKPNLYSMSTVRFE